MTVPPGHQLPLTLALFALGITVFICAMLWVRWLSAWSKISNGT